MWKRRLLLMGLVAAIMLLVHLGLPHLGFSQARVSRVVRQLETTLPGGQDHAGTPVERIVAEHPLRAVYYYHFAASVPVNVRPVFEEAVAIYNRTGVVKLVAGQPGQHQNGITFFTYHRAESGQQPDFLELGEGGPEIRRYVGLGAYTINRAKAGLNLAHPQAGIRSSVALHELGHAVGLDHSKSRQSTMYPLDQGHLRLSSADLKTLRVLYKQNS
ncbi:matrixin family metalloprotease [Levilactobacillus tujiorum]|uniref:matrixin family metalloprotease n=1 Tax=Levilactobacillus tujiorum TaxID=2912243 RepID=UPI0014566447|nr:matrixin family metalloprotease [Levilactobacillus tujiorum]NLR31249.1 matrixin family metalloprotease [Levilactobacillus tujiorum]